VTFAYYLEKNLTSNHCLKLKCPGIRFSFEYTTTLLSGEGGEGRTGTATMFRKMLSKYTISQQFCPRL